MAIVRRAERASPNEKKEVLYQDILLTFAIGPDNRDLELLTNEDSVRQSILSILSTNTKEKLFNNNFGSDLNKLLFENVSPQTSTALINLIKSSIENFEPRATIIDIVVSPALDDNAYAVTIVFSVINKTEPISLEFVLNRVR